MLPAFKRLAALSQNTLQALRLSGVFTRQLLYNTMLPAFKRLAALSQNTLQALRLSGVFT